jgi:D-3-phosphoglycerate dehydrogenase / 2-oxoglutarate reductase
MHKVTTAERRLDAAATIAERTLGLMLALGHRFRQGQAGINRGSFAVPPGTGLHRETVGVIGLGHIGRAVVKRLAAFECKVLVHTPRHDTELAARAGFEYADLSTVLSHSDFVTLHAPLTPQTHFLIREATIRLMKPTAFVINTARAGLVEDRDLLLALESGELAGAGLDVFVSESDPSYHHVTHELASLPNVIALPFSSSRFPA